KMKWNWGTKILLAMILFMLLIGTFVFLSMRQTFYLVEKDYYPKGLDFQRTIDKINNSNSLEEKIRVESSDEIISIEFPSIFIPANIKGSVTFYRPSDTEYDVKYEISVDSTGKQIFPADTLHKGKYIIKIDYVVDEKAYYQEETIFLKMF
ncbi:MAG: FixH family protein, partial [Bacteroidales bacterium]|nr:FixH family protein [Bacteroidales bacterium]